MASSYNSKLITPPSEAEDIYPYRPVWMSMILEAGSLFAVALAFYIMQRIMTLPADTYPIINGILIALPALFWGVFSLWRERKAPRPRHNLIAPAIVAALATNGIGLPLIHDLFQVNEWLALQSAISRIVGYTFTVGITLAATIYIIVRYMSWSTHIRIRYDGIAYCHAAAIGCITILGVNDMLTQVSEPMIMAMNMFNHLAILYAMSLPLGYGLAETRLNKQPFPLIMVALMAFAALLAGIATPMIAGLTNTSLSTLSAVSTTNPLMGFLFAAVMLGGVGVVFWFLFNVADREAPASENSL